MADYESILRDNKYPAKRHAQRVVDHLLRSHPSVASAVLYLEGGHTKLIENADQEEPFRQRRYFYYLTGCELPDCQLTYDVAAKKSTLYIPPVDEESVIWSGLPVGREEAKERWDVDEVRFATDLNADLVALASAGKKEGKNPRSVFAIADQVSHHITFVQYDAVNLTALKRAIEEVRVVKDEYEVALMRKANAISDEAHRAVLDEIARGDVANETELEAAFLARCVRRGAKKQAYSTIMASGTAAATLHYVGNDQGLAGKLNLLLDGGCEWDCYASDITRVFPLTGKFTKESRAIYDIVLSMQTQCLGAIKASVRWEDVHELAHRIAIDGLLSLGILRGGDAQAIFDARTSVAFFPHGLGHYLGMDTHDTGGNPDYEDKDAMLRYLRIRGRLPSGSVVTVEPGIYFCKFIIEPYLNDEKHARFIDAAVLDKYWDVGGVRIEDDVVVTDEGIDDLTTTVKDPDEIESIIAAARTG